MRSTAAGPAATVRQKPHSERQWPRSNLPVVTASSTRQLEVIKNCGRTQTQLGWLKCQEMARADRFVPSVGCLGYLLAAHAVRARKVSMAARTFWRSGTHLGSIKNSSRLEESDA